MATRIVATRHAGAGPKASHLDFERKPFYAPAEVASILGVSTQTVLDRIHDGSLYGLRLSARIYRIPLGGLLQFLGEPPRITRRTRKLRRLPNWDRQLARAETRS